MSPLVVTIGHGNGHNKPELVAFADRSNCASFGINEGHRLLDEFRGIDGTRLTVAGQGVDDPRARSTSIVTDDVHNNLGDLTLRAGKAMPEVSDKLYPDRFLVGVRYEHPIATTVGAVGVAHFEAHPPPTVMRHDSPRHPVVESYRDYLELVHRQMAAAREDGFLNVLTGDLQANARYAAPWGPRAMLAKPLNLKCRVVRIDWIMIDKLLTFDGPLTLHRLHDHTGFVAKLRAAN